MEPKTEQITLEYKVEFEDGLRPRVHVYGINLENQEVYGAFAYFGVIVGAGSEVKPLGEKQAEEHHLPFDTNVQLCAQSFISQVATTCVGKLPEEKDWEQKLIYAGAKKAGWNVIKVQSPEHVQPAIDRHRELYMKQFYPLAEEVMALFQDFLKEHPGYGQY